MVPEQLRNRWTLTEGKSQKKLAGVLEQSEPIGVFIHDSEHSTPCTMMEYELAWNHMREGGVILSDDIFSSKAFELFAAARPARSGLLAKPNNGYLIRTSRHEVPVDL